MIEFSLVLVLGVSLLLNVALLTRPRVNVVELVKHVYVPVDVSIERIKHFFQILEPLFERIYEIVDSYKAKTGHPPLDHQFQIRFLIWHWIFRHGTLDDSREHLNETPDLQKVLAMPCATYHSSTLTRFLERIGKVGLTKVIALVVRYAMQRGVISLKNLIIDTFPIYSPIRAKKFYTQVQRAFGDLWGVLGATDWTWTTLYVKPGRGRKPAWTALVSTFWFEYLYAFPSLKTFVKCLTKLPEEFQKMVLSQKMPGYGTCTKHWRVFQTQEQYQGLLWLLYCQLYGFLRQTDPVKAYALPDSWIKCRGLLQGKAFHLDPGAKINYCATKDEYYYGRGGLTIVDGDSEIPIFGDTQSQLKVNADNLSEHLKEVQNLLGDLLQDATMNGDSEFTNTVSRQVVEQILPQIRLQDLETLPREDQKRIKRQRVAVERTIGRNDTFYKLEHPNVRGDQKTRSWTQLGILASLLVAIYAKETDQEHLARSIKFLRQ